MAENKIEPHKITKPIQLMAVWFVALLLIDSALLTSATFIKEPCWIPPLLVISAICFVPLFVGGVFLMQTVFRKELEKAFENFKAENIESHASNKVSITAASLNKCDVDLESERKTRYELQRGLFIIHSWRPSITSGQVADIVIWLHQHGEGPLSNGLIEKVEYQLGPKFFTCPLIKMNIEEQFRVEVSAYGPLLCLARVFIKDISEPIILERYLDFEEPPNKSVHRTH